MGCRPEQCLSLLPTNQCPPTILFNHESPRRGETFVTRKITRGLARIDAGLGPCPRLREMQWRMLQQSSRTTS